MKTHPYADLFPMMSDEEIKVLAADIETNGMREDITFYQDMILDGRNRYAAMMLVCPDNIWVHGTDVFEGTDAQALAFVLSKNLHRRHLTTGQRAAIAADLANMTVGQPEKNSVNSQNNIPVEKAASMLDVSPKSVHEARKVQRADPEIAKAVRNGKITLNAAAKKVTQKAPATISWKRVLGDDTPKRYDPNMKTGGNTMALKAEVEEEYGQPLPDRVVPKSDIAIAIGEAMKRADAKHTKPKDIEPVEAIREEVKESDKAKFDRLLQKAEASLRANIEAEIRKRVDARCDEIRERMHKKEMELVSFERRLQARAQGQGFMKAEEFKLILGCLHPDRESPLDRKAKAFNVFNKMQFGIPH